MSKEEKKKTLMYAYLITLILVIVVCTCICLRNTARHKQLSQLSYSDYQSMIDYEHFADMEYADNMLSYNGIHLGNTPHIAYHLKDMDGIAVISDSTPDVLFIILKDGTFIMSTNQDGGDSLGTQTE